ncbi:MAG: cgtA [Clostridia bacterium]|nr:cgtA [Clostridia bacterium]
MFVDNTKIYVKAGSGGDGAVAFLRERFVAAGGPDGGDGGKGGDILFVVDDNLNTLVDLRFKHKFVAPDGENGKESKMYGKSGNDLIIRIPRGTLIKDAESGLVIKDMSEDEPYILAKGGNGGWGNRHFATPTRQCPRFAKPGIPGEEKEVILELKLIADVGLIGYPNVGKSTLLSAVSAARPKIANYHFTTLTPNLGVVSIEENKSFVMADIPGIIEGASGGLGLGHEFLRHVERCRLLVHIIDISGSEGRNPIEDYLIINKELETFSPQLSKCPQIVVGNKIDAISDISIADSFRDFIKTKDIEYYEISAATLTGTQLLKYKIYDKLSTLPSVKIYEKEYYDKVIDNPKKTDFKITKIEDVYIVESLWLLNLMRSVNFEDTESLQYFQRVLKTSGIIDNLRKAGIKEGETVSIYDFEFEFFN